MTIAPSAENAYGRYVPRSDARDECFAPDGSVRPCFQPLVRSLEAMDLRTFARRWDEGQRAIRDNGVTYHVHELERGFERPFALDPLPLVLDAEEWASIERGVAQRATVLDAFLGDVYGRRAHLGEHCVPPGVVFGHPSFLRPCVGFEVPGKRRLHIYAADLVRGPDGQWQVIADHAQTPLGAGFALENRIVVSRMLPEAFRAVRAQRLAGFFKAMRAALIELAPRHRDNPRVVLLTPGALSESYLEQAYLAQYLGFTLVQGDDLTVRDGRVYLKTLGGLEPVDVVLRRLADDYADPLELRNESTLGTVGLVAAAREGQVAIANALGSGVAESGALLPYVAKLAEALLGETLILPSVSATWLGDTSGIDALLEEDVLVRAAYGHRGMPVVPRTLSTEERTAFVADVQSRPHAFVAQKRLTPSTVPVWEGTGVVPRPLTLRVFAVARGDDYAVMPGGLARVGRGSDPALAWAEKDKSKDCWLVASGEVHEISLLRPVEAPVELRRGGIDLPSRIADHLFWLGRYAERLEAVARVLRAALTSVADDNEGATLRAVQPYARVLEAMGASSIAASDSPTAWLVGQVTHPTTGLLEPLREHLRRNGSSVRDRLSSDTWRVLVSLDELLSNTGDELDANEALGRTNDILFACSALAGMGKENMTRGPSYRFFDLGRRIERAVFAADGIRAMLAIDRAADREELEALLRIADSTITYRSRYLTTLQFAPVLDLMLTDTSNPRSIAFQVERLGQHVAALPHESRGALPTTSERIATRLHAAITLTDPLELGLDTVDARRALLELLRSLVADLEALSDAVVTAYLTHALPSRMLAASGNDRENP